MVFVLACVEVTNVCNRARKEQQEREERARKLLEEDSVETVSLVLNERTDKLKVSSIIIER